MFNLFMYKSLPQVKIVSARVKPVKKEKPATFESSTVFTNEGFLPTALKMADRIKIVRPDAVRSRLPAGARIRRRPGPPGYRLSAVKRDERGPVESQGQARHGAEAEVTISSTRGGVARTKVKIG